MVIDYRKIADAVEHYTNLGYNLIDTPWWVSESIKEITKPRAARDDYKLSANGKTLVASGEQSFLYLMSKGILNNGKYVTVTPCFRNEDHDELHRKFFMKCELIYVNSTSDNDLEEITNDALSFFNEQLKLPNNKKAAILDIIETTPDDSITIKSQDIMALFDDNNSIELGSYGIRKYGSFSWVYGTGIAEPRLSIVEEMIKNN